MDRTLKSQQAPKEQQWPSAAGISQARKRRMRQRESKCFSGRRFFVAILLISLDNMRRMVYNKSSMGMK